MRAVFASYDDAAYVDEDIRGKEAFIKAAVLMDHKRSNVILSEQVIGFMIGDYNVEKPLSDKMKQVIADYMLPKQYDVWDDEDADDMPGCGKAFEYNYIFPNSDKSLEVAKLVDKIFANVINMTPSLENKYNIPTSAMPYGFINTRLRTNMCQSHRRKYIAEWLQSSKKCSNITDYLRHNYENNLS